EATCEPKPVQSPLPLLVGGGGERRTMRIAARLADEWHTWGTADVFRHKSAVMDERCGEVGRDPSTIRRSTGASIGISTDAEELAALQEVDATAVLGTPSQVAEQV